MPGQRYLNPAVCPDSMHQLGEGSHTRGCLVGNLLLACPLGLLRAYDAREHDTALRAPGL